MNTTFAESVHHASTRPEVHTAIRALYQSLQSQIDIRRPLCQTSGRCCRFDEFGHRLYVTTAEMATFLHDLPPEPKAPANPPLDHARHRLAVLPSCRYQLDGLCSVHAIRPFGCRIFFCDASSIAWQHEQYEIFHNRLKLLHQDFKIEYFYVEWREALAAVGL
jgi:Fe-S-cluster containining protein